jgi:hypothetical protein
MPPPLLLRSHACPRHFIRLPAIVVSSHLHAPAVLFCFAVLLRALLSRVHLARNACAQCAVFTADGTVKGSTFDVIAAVAMRPAPPWLTRVAQASAEELTAISQAWNDRDHTVQRPAAQPQPP